MNKKSILITGSSRGIGRACAKAYAKAGYHVFLNCVHQVERLEELAHEILSDGGSCTTVPGDVSNPDEVRKIFQVIKKECGGVDILINNAGIAWFGLLTDMTDNDWDKILATNLSSVFYCSRAAIPYMVSKKCGKILNISSMWGTVGASCEVAYSATKSGIHGLTRALAKELAPSNIQVNAIACGVIDTEMNGRLNEEERQDLMDEIPSGRFADPEEVAELALKLTDTPVVDTIGLVIPGIDPSLLEKMNLKKPYKSLGLISSRTGAAGQINAADEAVKSTNTEIVSIELPRDTKGWGGHGCFIVIGGANVSDVRRAVDITLEYIGKYAGELYISQAGHLEFTFSACADKALHMAFNAPIGKPFGFFCGSPAAIGLVMADLAVKSSPVEVIKYMTPDQGTSHSNEVIVAVTGDADAVKNAVLTARDVGLQLLVSMGSYPESPATPYLQ